MKKTLITIAAVVAASVSSAATLDFTKPTSLPSSVTFAGDGSDIITLSGATSLTVNVSGKNGSLTVTDYSIGGVNILNTNRAFVYQNGSTSDAALLGATINFGTDGSLTMKQDSGINLDGMDLTFNVTLGDFYVTTSDASLDGTEAGTTTRTIYTADGGAWNIEKPYSPYYTIKVSDVDGNTLASGADWTLNTENDSITLEYTQLYKYVAPTGGGAIPEPTTATLSLLALAGLATRRRRK